ncbi:MAG: hypothetical protein ACI9XO_002179 [Paraglaciecola sp.]|jgi:hypothetical protein
MENKRNGRRLTVDVRRWGTEFFRNFLFGILVIAASFVACEAPKGKTKKDVMDERVIRKIDSWFNTYSKKCEKDVLEAAAAIVDSTLIATARLAVNRANKPQRPVKPGQPRVDIPKDTTPIAPLINLLLLLGDTNLINSLLTDSLAQDTLQMDSLLMDSILRADYEFYFPDTLE